MAGSAKILITFGCSWTYGVGTCFQNGMQEKQYKSMATDQDICNKYSFRGILSDRYGFKNINFSVGGSSNQRQFRLAKNFFNSNNFSRLLSNASEIIVLWGITSTARSEICTVDKKLENIFYNKSNDIARFFVKHLYNHQHEVFMLAEEMQHWNQFFQKFNIKNYWFDTFNHHDYTANHPVLETHKQNYKDCAGEQWPTWSDYLLKKFDFVSDVGIEITDSSRFEFAGLLNKNTITNFVINHPTNRDLLAQLVIANSDHLVDTNYHLSDWCVDNNNIRVLVEQNLLNPYSHHPTQQGHIEIAKMFDYLFY